jgi:hypothetical protein
LAPTAVEPKPTLTPPANTGVATPTTKPSSNVGASAGG